MNLGPSSNLLGGDAEAGEARLQGAVALEEAGTRGGGLVCQALHNNNWNIYSMKHVFILQAIRIWRYKNIVHVLWSLIKLFASREKAVDIYYSKETFPCSSDTRQIFNIHRLNSKSWRLEEKACPYLQWTTEINLLHAPLFFFKALVSSKKGAPWCWTHFQGLNNF